ncbi:MAG: PAS domain S-box protein [Pseudomonadota bacterium]
MKKWSIENKVLAGFGVAVAILLLLGALAYQSTLRYVEASRRVTQTHEALATLEEIFSLMNQAETGQRAYIITGDESYLPRRDAAIARIGELTLQLKQLTADEAEQQRRIPELARQIAARLALLDRTLEARKSQGFEAARQRLIAGSGRSEMDALRSMVTAMQEHERALLQQRADTERENAHRTLAMFSLALLFAVAFLTLLYLRIRQEIGERKQAEEALVEQAERLRESEARVHAIVETAAEGIIVINEQGVIDRFNPAAERIFGYAAAEMAGKNVSMLMPSPYREAHDGYLARYLETGEKRVIGSGREVTGMRKSGATFPMELAVSELRLADHLLFTGIVRDITERKQAEERQARLVYELESANEELKNFAYVVSHDLKAPLRAIGSLADWVVTDYADRLDDEGKEHMRLLLSRVRRMDGLIDGILQYSRVGRVKEASVAVDLDQLVHEVVDLLAPPANITIAIDNPLPTVVAERTRLQQVFQNLLSNAIKYLDKPEGKIRVGCAAAGDKWKLSVSDNGPGIEERHFEKIFQLFQTLAPRDRVESTGVGLALVKKIVEMYGGEIWVESKVGEGSTFFFTLPRTAAGADLASN